MDNGRFQATFAEKPLDVEQATRALRKRPHHGQAGIADQPSAPVVAVVGRPNPLVPILLLAGVDGARHGFMLDRKAREPVANRHGCERCPDDRVVIVPLGRCDPHDAAFPMVDRRGVSAAVAVAASKTLLIFNPPGL
jgi:hypothetical protein